MHRDVLIVGQGICGTFLSWYLEQKGLSYIVVDEARPFTASKAASGLINPVTGRRLVTTWMIDELLPWTEQAYNGIGPDLQIDCLRQLDLVDFFPTAQMRLAFEQRFEENARYLELPPDDHAWDTLFRYELGYGLIGPCYWVDLPRLLAAARDRLITRGLMLEQKFVLPETAPSGPIRYGDIDAEYIIFCDGIESFSNPWWSRLPFAPNKGEALLLEIPGLPAGIYKKGISLAPWGGTEGLYWAGSSYEWAFADDQPTSAFRERTEAVLRDWLKLPFTTLHHIAAVRPATLERRPFVGFHPSMPHIGILNGMGTKGCSLAPYFAHQLVEHMTAGSPIRPDADVKRFTKVLTR